MFVLLLNILDADESAKLNQEMTLAFLNWVDANRKTILRQYRAGNIIL